MSPRSLPRRVPLRMALLLWLSAGLSGCSVEPEPPASAATLQRHFPDRSAAVLEARDAFVADGEGFHLGSVDVRGRPSRLRVVLPREGSEPIRFSTPTGIEVRVREHGAAGDGTPVGRAVAYRRSGGTSFWSATEHGVEEWLLLDEGVARGEVVAVWQVEGATPRARGEAVELVEPGRGAAVLRVSAPRAYASSGRPVGMALTARGSRIELSVDAGGEAVLVDPAWQTAPSMNVARSDHTATLLPSGLVLVAGGVDLRPSEEVVLTLDSAELYDPATDSWSFTRGKMLHARASHTATLLPSGKVLVAGGRYAQFNEGYTPLDSAELYDPETDTWTDAGQMLYARAEHTATRLLSGEVLVAGGYPVDFGDGNVELYVPETNSWTLTGPMNVARAEHAATLLPSGEVLVSGGLNTIGSLDSVELYHPESGVWTLTAPMYQGRRHHTMTSLLNGEVLAAGGERDDRSDPVRAERYDPDVGRWTFAAPMIHARANHTATLLPDGLVLLAGGYSDSAERYDPAIDTWVPTGPMDRARIWHTATLLMSGEVLVAGGQGRDYALADAERFAMARGDACSAVSACFAGDHCVDGICCDAPCPCGTCSDQGQCGAQGSSAKVGTICAPPTCSGDTQSLAPAVCTQSSSACPRQASVDCIAYRCDPERGACKTGCASLDDCAPGFVCNLRGHCVPPPPTPGGASGASGCSAAPGRPAPAAACAAAVVLLALGAARRRRRTAIVAPAALAVALAAEPVSLAQPAGSPAPPAPPAAPPSAAPPGSPAEPPPGSPAEPPPTGDPVAEARAHFERGLDLYSQGAWEAALAEFLASRQVYPTWSATSSAALCLQQLRRYDEALALFETLLRDFSQKLPSDTRSAAQQAVVRLRGLVGTVDIVGAEIGASIMVDGHRRGDYPLPAPLRVAVGSHVVRVYKEGFEPFETRVDVAGGQVVRILSRLQKLVESGRLRVTEQQGRALDVLVDGYTVGTTPWEGALPPGHHSVVLRGPGDLGTMPASVLVLLRQTTPLALRAEELSSTLQIEPSPVCASITVDGVPFGSGVWEGRLSAGLHRVEVAAGGFIAARREVLLVRGARVVVPVALDRVKLGGPPGRFLLELAAAPVLVPSLGGIAAGPCDEACSPGLGAGALGVVHAGYELWSGFGFGVMTGYLQVHQTVTARRASLEIQDPLPESTGTVDDALALSGLLAGGWAGLSLGGRTRLSMRLGAGVLLGAVRDERSGTFNSSSGFEFHLDPTAARDAASFFVMTPEVRAGLRVGKHLELTAGLAASVLVRLKEPVWTNPAQGVYGRIDAERGFFGRFEEESLAGEVLVAIAPGIGARYTF
ncbi:kelch repeat-containing protein [Sorangium sp. So ce388]|uniref:kelch repeat-containing protein n=1 Tax=Sorangium sp. So ce388 TaxID=3133309 RepID=UPI003F5C716E